MEAAAEMLEAKFQKAESDLNHLTRKLEVELRCQNHADGDRRNPLELLRKVNAVKDEYKTLLKESAEIQKAQAEAMDFFRSQLSVAFQALQELQRRVGMNGSEEDKAKVEELESLLGIQIPSEPTQSASVSQPAQATSATEENNGAGGCPEQPPAENPQSKKDPANGSCAVVVEDPVASRAALRAESSKCVEVSQEEFESVSELIRCRVKLSEVNAVYSRLYTHFKEEGNSNPLLLTDMHKMGLRVSGATGQAKLKVLRALKLLTISAKQEVKLV